MDSKDQLISSSVNDSMDSVQPADPSAQQTPSDSIPKSLLSSNQSKNSDFLLDPKTTQAFFTFLYQISKFNSSTAKDSNSQQSQKNLEDTKSISNLSQQDSLTISQLSDIQEFNRALLLQFQQNEQNNMVKHTKPKSIKKDKKAKEIKEGKSLKKHSDGNRLKFTRSKSQPNSAFFGRSEYLIAPKKICIPDWKYANENSDNPNNDSIDSSIPNGKFEIQMHKRLEVYENRIANGLTKYNHPAYSVQLENDESSTDIIPSEIEKQKLENYESDIPQQKIPLFWEPRSWDTEDSHMTEDESHKLQLQIENEESEESISNLIRLSPKYKYNKKYTVYTYSSSSSSQSSSSSLSPLDSPYNSYSTGKKKKDSSQYSKDRRRFGVTPASINRRATEIEISNLYYETDESCDETDIELF